MDPGKRSKNCWAREVAEARWPPPVSEERKRTLRDLLDEDGGGGGLVGEVVDSWDSVAVACLSSSLPLQSAREEDSEEMILFIILD